MEKHILIMGGIWNTDALLRNVYKCRTTLFIETDQVCSGLENYYDRIITFPKGSQTSEWVEMAKLVHKLEPIDRVGNYGFYYQDKGVEIAKCLGLAVFNPEQAVRCADDKLYMREVLRKKNLDPCASMLIQTEKELIEFSKEYGFPIIIKPKNGVASRGIFRINNELELTESYAQFRKDYPDFEIIVEEFLVGPEFSVETYSEGGEHRIITITEKFKDEKSFVELGHLVPARLPDGVNEQEIISYIKNFLSAIEVQTGPAHSEIILTSNGPRIIETQLRLGGDMIPRLMQLSTGIDFWDMTAKQAMGQKAFELLPDRLEYYKSSTILYALPVNPGIFREFSNVDSVLKQDGIDRVDSLKPIGYNFDGVLESSKRACSVIAFGEDSNSAIKNAMNGLNNLKIDIDTGKLPYKVLPENGQL